MSSLCPGCGGAMVRQRRTFIERIVFRRVLSCERCGVRQRARRVPFESTIAFVFARHTHCILCGTARVRRLPARDRIDRMSRHPYSLLSGLIGAPIYHCGSCRLQHHDWRTPELDATAAKAASSRTP